jgi:hypothetical protein
MVLAPSLFRSEIAVSDIGRAYTRAAPSGQWQKHLSHVGAFATSDIACRI